jgi:hypothetical protein
MLRRYSGVQFLPFRTSHLSVRGLGANNSFKPTPASRRGLIQALASFVFRLGRYSKVIG